MSETLLKKCLTSWDPACLPELSGAMLDAEQAGSQIYLDLSEESLASVETPSAVRLNTSSVQVLVNLLLGRYRDLPIEIRLPQNRGINLQLARGGLFFCLSNRSNVHWTEGEPAGWDKVVPTWVRPFHPNDTRMYREALATKHDLSQEDWVVRAAFQRYLLSVIHPHRRPAQSLKHELDKIARRWLSGRLGVHQGSVLISTLMDCAEVFYEIVVNVPDHAGIGMKNTGASLGQLYATLGGGRESCNRLNFSAIDNGVGLPQRVNEKFQDRHRNASEALVDSVTGKLPRRVGGRGVGLTKVREISSRYSEMTQHEAGKSQLRIITRSDTSNASEYLEWGGDSESPSTDTIAELPIEGTLVWVSLALERRTESKDIADQLELTFAEPESDKSFA